MKRILPLFALCSFLLASCQSPQDTARLSALADLAITYSARRGVITEADVEALRAANAIILPPATSAKQPRHVSP